MDIVNNIVLPVAQTSFGFSGLWTAAIDIALKLKSLYEVDCQNSEDRQSIMSQLISDIEDLRKLDKALPDVYGSEIGETLRGFIVDLRSILAECETQKSKGTLANIFNAEANRMRLASLSERIHNAQQRFLVRNSIFTMQIVNEIRSNLSQILVNRGSHARSYSVPEAHRTIGGYQATAVKRKMAYDETILDLAITTKKRKLALIQRTLKVILDANIAVTNSEFDMDPFQVYEPDLDDPFYDIYNNSFEIWRRQDALAEIVALLELLQVEAAKVETATAAVMWFSRANRLSEPLRCLGLREEALKLCKKAYRGIRELSTGNIHLHQRQLSESLMSLSVCLSGVGDKRAALQAIQDSVNIHDSLTEMDPDSHSPRLARALNVLSLRQNAVGQKEEALASIQEAVRIWRKSVATDSGVDAYNADLAQSLNNLSIQLDALKREGAHEAIVESVDIRRTLAKSNPDAYTPGLTVSLNNLSLSWRRRGEKKEALLASSEAALLLMDMVTKNRDAFEPDLGMCLRNLSLCLSDEKLDEDALIASQESVRIFRSQAERYPEVFRRRLADALDVLKYSLRNSGKFEEALKVKEEARELRHSAH